MRQIKIGYPFSYGDELTPEMAKHNRNLLIDYSLVGLNSFVLINQTSFITETDSIDTRTCIERVLSIGCGGDLGKSGAGPRAKADAARNAGKNGGGSIFVNGFIPQRQYCSYHTNKPLSCQKMRSLKIHLRIQI